MSAAESEREHSGGLPGFADDEIGKLFIGGLSWKTNQGTLREYFSKFGKLNDCVIMKNPANGRSRGFGFVRYVVPTDADRVFEMKEHILDGKKIDPKICTPKKQSQLLKQQLEVKNKRKVFVGGLPTQATEDQLEHIFTSQNMKVSEVAIMREPDNVNGGKGKSRGFGFITFEEEEDFQKAVNLRHINILGKQVELKQAEPKTKNVPSYSRRGSTPLSDGVDSSDGYTPQTSPLIMQPPLTPCRPIIYPPIAHPSFMPSCYQPTYASPMPAYVFPPCSILCYPQGSYAVSPPMPPVQSIMTPYSLPLSLPGRPYSYSGPMEHQLLKTA